MNFNSLRYYRIEDLYKAIEELLTKKLDNKLLDETIFKAVYEELSKYKVDKIISHEGEVNDKFTLLLLDGTKKIVAVQENDEPIESNENEFTIVYEALYKSLNEIKNNPKKLFISNNKAQYTCIYFLHQILCSFICYCKKG